jgi:uncharacterized membrane protein
VRRVSLEPGGGCTRELRGTIRDGSHDATPSLFFRLLRCRLGECDFYRAATFTLIGGAAVSLFARADRVLGLVALYRSGYPSPTHANAHALTMLTVTALVLADIAVRVFVYPDDSYTPIIPLVLSIAAALLTVLGGTIGGTLAYDYGFNVETAADSPVWHPSEHDVTPADKHITPTPPDSTNDTPT